MLVLLLLLVLALLLLFSLLLLLFSLLRRGKRSKIGLDIGGTLWEAESCCFSLDYPSFHTHRRQTCTRLDGKRGEGGKRRSERRGDALFVSPGLNHDVALANSQTLLSIPIAACTYPYVFPMGPFSPHAAIAIIHTYIRLLGHSSREADRGGEVGMTAAARMRDGQLVVYTWGDLERRARNTAKHNLREVETLLELLS